MARSDIFVCPVCHTKNDDTKKYCISCGTWLLSETFPATKYQRKKRGGALKTFFKVIGYTLGTLALLIGLLVYWTSTEDGQKFLETSGSPASVTTVTPPAETEADYKTSTREIDYESLARNPERLKGERIKLSGQASIVVEQGNYVGITLALTETDFGWMDYVSVVYERPRLGDRVLQNDIITVWGEVRGLEQLTTVTGDPVLVPGIDARYIEISTE